jgi:hypothetical protein
MISGAIAYQILQQENPQSIEKVKAVLEKHPWYTNQWQAKLQDVPFANRDMVLLCRRQGGRMIFVSGTGNTTGGRGIISIGRLNRRGNRRVSKSEIPSR